jgi:hypothetical protein
MAALQSFQAEIEDIRNRELARTRSQAQPEAPKRGHIDHKPKLRKKAVGGDTQATSPVTPKFTNEQWTQELTDIEHSIEARHSYTAPIRHFYSYAIIV